MANKRLDEDGLNPRQRLFVDEYLVEMNATRAAIAAGYSKKAAHVWGYNLLNQDMIAQAVNRAKKERSERTMVTADKVINELAKIGFANAGDYFKWGKDGVELIDKGDLTPDQRAAVAEISETTSKDGGTIRLKLHDKVAALEKLGRHLRLFEPALPSPNQFPSDNIREELAARVDALGQRVTLERTTVVERVTLEQGK